MMMMASAHRRFHWKDAFQREDVRRIWYVRGPVCHVYKINCARPCFVGL